MHLAWFIFMMERPDSLHGRYEIVTPSSESSLSHCKFEPARDAFRRPNIYELIGNRMWIVSCGYGVDDRNNNKYDLMVWMEWKGER